MRADMYETADLGYAAKRQNFTGEHKDWPFTAYMGCANPKSTEALSQLQQAEHKTSRTTILSCILPSHCCVKGAPRPCDSEEQRSQRPRSVTATTSDDREDECRSCVKMGIILALAPPSVQHDAL